MRNSWKVAKWEVRRNLKNKTYLIGLAITPLLFLGFFALSSLLGDEENDAAVDVYVYDQIGIFGELKRTVKQQMPEWNIYLTNKSAAELFQGKENREQTAYIVLKRPHLEEGTIPLYATEDLGASFFKKLQMLILPIRLYQLKQLDLSKEQLNVVTRPLMYERHALQNETGKKTSEGETLTSLSEKEIIPGLFAALILFSIVFSGMHIFQSASNEKKDKMGEILLSSVTPGELMQGKVIGYFILGMIQAAIFIAIAIFIALWKFPEISVFENLFTPVLLLYLFIALLGYLGTAEQSKNVEIAGF